MATKLSFCLFLILAAAILFVESVTRPEITNQYRKTLQRLQNVTNQTYHEQLDEVDFLYQERTNNVENIINTIASDMTSLRTTLENDIRSHYDEARICLENLRELFVGLSPGIVYNCMDSEFFNILYINNYKLVSIGILAEATIKICQDLNPLDTQDESYKRCVVDKIVDMNDQISIIERVHVVHSNDTLNYYNGCFIRTAVDAFVKLAEISYGMKFCLFKFKEV